MAVIPPTAGEPTRSDVLARLLSGAEFDAQQLVTSTGLSQSTVFRSLEELLRIPALLERRFVPQVGRGRPTAKMSFNRRFALVVGVDLGGTNCRIVLADAVGTALAKVRLTTPHDLSSAQLADWLADAILHLSETFGGDSALGAVGIGLPGAMTLDKNHVVGSHNLPPIVGTEFIDRIRGRFSAPVRFENDSNLALLGELSYGETNRADTTVLLIMGTGISAAAAVNGEILSGREGSLGEFGRLSLPGSGLLIRDLLSGAGLADFARSKGISVTSSKELFAKIELYPDLIGEVDETLQYLLEIIALAYEPRTILLTGGFSEIFLPARLEQIARTMSEVSLVSCGVRRSDLGDDSGLLGAMALASLTLYAELGVDEAQLDAMPQAELIASHLAAASTVSPLPRSQDPSLDDSDLSAVASIESESR